MIEDKDLIEFRSMRFKEWWDNHSREYRLENNYPPQKKRIRNAFYDGFEAGIRLTKLIERIETKQGGDNL